MKTEADMEEIVAAFLERCKEGPSPEIQDFIKQYPMHRKQLERLLPLVMQMEGYAGDCNQELVLRQMGVPTLEGSDYELLRPIGSGGMGVVYEARQRSLNRTVAVKVLAGALLKDEHLRQLLEHEAQVIARLHHPNIVKILSADCSSEHCYYAMEYIQGRGVDKYSFVDVRKIAKIGLQTAKALAYAHSCHVLHRDIKPANLLLDPEGNVHVSDFGLAFMLNASGVHSEDPATLHGTVRYMPPERIAYGVNTFVGDQYALGVTLYEMVTRHPILTEGSHQSQIARILQGPLPPLSCADADFAAIVNKCIAFDPESRYPSMEHVAADLQRFLEHKVVSVAPASTFRRLRLWVKRKPTVATLSLIGVLLFLAFVIALGVGYVRTDAARKLAEKNATHAHATLTDIFFHIEQQPPTTRGTELLSRLMPYYQDIAQQKATPDQWINANKIIGTSAMRSGEYAIAETAFRHWVNASPTSNAMSQLAEVLTLQGKRAEATALYQTITQTYPDTVEAVLAYQALGDYTRALSLLQERLQVEPENPEIRYLYACVLGTYPQIRQGESASSIAPNALAVLLDLVNSYPSQPKYAMALMNLMSRKLMRKYPLSEDDQANLDSVLSVSYRLLGGFSNTPGVVPSVTGLHRSYVHYLRRSGERPTARKELERLQGMLELLSYNPDLSDSVKELLQAIKTEDEKHSLPPKRYPPFKPSHHPLRPEGP